MPQAAGPWAAGDGACTAAGGEFSVPATGWDYEVLRGAGADTTEVWLAHTAADFR